MTWLILGSSVITFFGKSFSLDQQLIRLSPISALGLVLVLGNLAPFASALGLSLNVLHRKKQRKI